MPRTIEKPEALELLAENRQALLGGEAGCVMCALVARAATASELVRESEQGVVYDTDERARPAHVFSWSAGVVVYEDGEAAALAERLRAAW